MLAFQLLMRRALNTRFASAGSVYFFKERGERNEDSTDKNI